MNPFVLRRPESGIGLILLLLALIPEIGSAQKSSTQYPVAAIPPGLAQDARAVTRLNKTELIISQDDKATLRVHTAVTILKPTGDELSLVKVGFDGELVLLNSLEARAYNAYGKQIKRIKRNDFELYNASTGSFFDNGKVAVADLSQASFPFTVEVLYELTLKNPFYYPSWQPQSEEGVSLQKGELSVWVPTELTMRYQMENMAGRKAVITKDSKGTWYQWSLKDLPAIQREPYGPRYAELSPMVRMAPGQYKVKYFADKMDTWKQFGMFYRRLNEGRDALPKELQEKLTQLLEGTQNDRGKIERIYRFVQENTRYVSIQLGMGGFQTYDAKYVYENSYGDCKALTNYTHSLLTAAGITSHPTIVRAGRNAKAINPGFPSNQFNHVILCVPQQEDTLWFECTSTVSPPNYLGGSTEDRWVVVVTPEGGALRRTPARSAVENSTFRKGTIAFTSDGKAEVSAAYNFLGHPHEGVRYFQGKGSPREQEEWLKEQLPVTSYKLGEYTLAASPDEPTSTLGYGLTANNVASKSGNRLFITPNLLAPSVTVPKAIDKRTQEVVLPASYQERDSLVLVPPKGYVLESSPVLPIEINSPFGYYRVDLEKLPDGKMIYTRLYRVEKGTFAPESYSEFRRFRKRVNKADKFQVVLSDKS
ncbi:MAG: DUF3857 domain-containing protein [Bacteroidota bacterium]